VAATGASVNDTDVFILDDNKTVYTWLGARFALRLVIVVALAIAPPSLTLFSFFTRG
jgi:hypothetical protein